MAEFKDERVYESRRLTQVFLWSSLALLLAVVWMAWKDYNRSWKDYQRKFMKMDRSRTLDKRNEVASVIVDDYKRLKVELKEARADLMSHHSAISKLESKQAKLDAQVYKFTQDYQLTKAKIDAEKFKYSEGLKNNNGKGDAKEKKHLDGLQDEADALSQKLFELDQAQKETKKEMDALTAKRDEVTEKIKKLTPEYSLLQTKLKGLSFNFLFYFRNAMLLDFMSPTLQIQKVILHDIPEDMYFTKTMRVDSCITCHQAIDKKGWEDAPQPFKTHPHLERYLGSSSPHPLDKIGCTICHGGVGPAVDFTSAAHMPNDEEQEKKWIRKYHWKEPEGVNVPMLPLKYTEGSCLKCHGMQEHVNFAPHLNRGRELMVTRGCVGCHKVKGLEDLPKAGPSLIKLKGKLSREFVEKWIWSPKAFNPAARMPSFFQQSNNSDPEGLDKTKAELKALVAFLYDRSGEYRPREAAPAGSAARGKKLFKETGCMACHGINDVTSHHADFAPDLSGSGSKLSANWVYTWIRNPQHYDPETRMPSLRLSNTEAADITAYLMSKKNADFEQAAPPEEKPEARDALILDYLKPQVGVEGAKTRLASMDEKGKNLFLGEKTLNKYGCFGCHKVAGYETAQGIGAELSEWGSKRVNQLDFGFTDLPHSHESFINAKLQEPRRFDKDKVQGFQDRLKMPNFYFTDEEREAVATAVLGLTKTYVPDTMMAGLHGNGPLLEKGRRVLAEFNCRGCHMIEAKGKSIDEILKQGQGGKILEMYKNDGLDYSLGPPNLNTEGAKLQVNWFHDFLTNVHPIRPWLKIRMPSFHWTDERLSAVISYFNLKDDQVFPFKSAATAPLAGADLAQAKALFAKLQCAKCHIVGSKVPADLASAAPDLLKVRERLKPDWVVEWLEDPAAIMPDTRMTGFWPKDDQGKELPSSDKAFGGNGKKQREALRDYLFMLGK